MPRYSVAVASSDARDAVRQIRMAEEAGIGAAWMSMGGTAGGDPLTLFATALGETERIILGSAIVQTWPRHPLVTAQQVVTLSQLAPGRVRLGVGPSHRESIEGNYGIAWSKPLTHLREYTTVLRTLFQTGAVDLDGSEITARGAIPAPVDVPVYVAGLRARSFEVAGEVSDGAISWLCPLPYLGRVALPAMAAGAAAAGREPPPLVAHVLAHVGDRERGEVLVRPGVERMAGVSSYRAMFQDAVGPEGIEHMHEHGRGQVLSGPAEEVAAGLRAYLDAGCGEVMVQVIADPDERDASIARAFEVVGALARAEDARA